MRRPDDRTMALHRRINGRAGYDPDRQGFPSEWVDADGALCSVPFGAALVRIDMETGEETTYRNDHAIH